MPHKSSSQASPQERYWERRIRSRAFKRALTTLVARELRSLSRQHVKDVLDVDLVRRIIRDSDVSVLDRRSVADLLIEGNRCVARRLKGRRRSLLGLLDQPLVAGLEAVLDEDVKLSSQMETFVAKVMRQEFVRRLFTEIIFTSMVSFYQTVNPLFGGIAMRVLEEQIKGFIRLFMPMVQKRATAFAVKKQNQRILLDFARSIIRHVLDEPLPHYAAMVSSGQRRKAEALVRKAVENAKLDALIRELTLAVWDDLYRRIRDKKVGDLLRLEEHAGRLAERSIEVILPALARPHTVRFVAAEIALAAGSKRSVGNSEIAAKLNPQPQQ